DPGGFPDGLPETIPLHPLRHRLGDVAAPSAWTRDRVDLREKVLRQRDVGSSKGGRPRTSRIVCIHVCKTSTRSPFPRAPPRRRSGRQSAAACRIIRGMWQLSISPIELVARSAIVYLLFLAALRISGKRELGQFTLFDFALVLLAANALQPAITGPDASLPGAVIIVATFFTLNRLVALARRRVPFVHRLLDFPATV